MFYIYDLISNFTFEMFFIYDLIPNLSLNFDFFYIYDLISFDFQSNIKIEYNDKVYIDRRMEYLLIT